MFSCRREEHLLKIGNEKILIKIGKYFFLLKIFSHFFFFRYRKLFEGIVGIKSICEDGKHVLFIDIDDANWNWVMRRIKEMQFYFKLSDVHVFVTKPRSFHIVCLDKFTFGEIIDIQRWFDVDLTKQYQRFAVLRGYWVLRISKKYNRSVPIYYDTIRSEYEEREQSYGHAKFFKDFGIQINLKNSDKKDKIWFDSYPAVVKEIEETT